jgi:hypothetical protein
MSVTLWLPGVSGAMSVEGGVEHRLEDTDAHHYSYGVHNSGALTLWTTRGHEEPTVDVVYGPGAWIKVSGQQKGQFSL